MKTWITLACSLVAAATFAAVPVIEGTGNADGAGFIKVTVAGGSETILAVAFKDCMSAGQTIALGNLVSTTGLPNAVSSSEANNAARLYVANGTSYLTYYNDASTGWTAYDTGTAAGLTRTVGDAVWLVMPGTSETTYSVYIKGDLVSSQSVTVSQGLNLICAAKTEGYKLSALTVTTPAGTKLRKADYFMIPATASTSSKTFYWDAANSTFRLPGDAPYTTWDDVAATIPAGTGIWYYRSTNTTAEITLTAPAQGE